jgi:hypothetical protein
MVTPSDESRVPPLGHAMSMPCTDGEILTRFFSEGPTLCREDDSISILSDIIFLDGYIHRSHMPPIQAISEILKKYRLLSRRDQLTLKTKLRSHTKKYVRDYAGVLDSEDVSTSSEDSTSRDLSWFRQVADNFTNPKVCVPLMVVIVLVYTLYNYRLRHKKQADKEKSQRMEELQMDLLSAEHQLRLAVGRAKDHKALPFVKALKLYLPVIPHENLERVR